MDGATSAWFDREIAGCSFADERLNKRLRNLLERMGDAIGASIPLACQDWANTKAAYRFFSNDRFNEAEILAGHFQSTQSRFAATEGPILVLQDTTEFSYQRERPERIGLTYRVNSGKDKAGRFRMHTVCGLLMHRWLENMRQSTALFGEPARCIHVGDRESDIYELFCVAQELGTHFLVRSCVDRLAEDGDHTIADEMKDAEIAGQHHVEVCDSKGHVGTATVEIRYRSIHVLPPIGKQKRYPALTLTVLHAQEREEPTDRARIDWKLITDLPVHSYDAAIEKLRWYALRWKIEVFHKVLKSGCRAEEARLRTAERLVKLLSVFCILSWRVFWMTMINRSVPNAEPGLALTKVETRLLDQLVPDTAYRPPRGKTLSHYLTKIARLGGYLARASDPPPGNTVMWRGLSRLTDIKLGATLCASYG